MKPILYFLLLTICTSLVHAQAPLDSLERIIEKARSGEAQWSQAIDEISKLAERLDSREDFERHFSQLDPLLKISQDLNLSENAKARLKMLGKKMAEDGIRWIRPTDDDSTFLLALHQWLSPSGMSDLQAQWFLETVKETQPDRLKVLCLNTEKIWEWLRSNQPNQLSVINRYHGFISELALRIVRTENFSDSDFPIWLQKINSTEALTGILQDLLQSMAPLKKGQTKPLSRLIDHLSQIRGHLADLGRPAPLALKDLLGDAAANLILKGLQLEYKFPDGFIADLLTTLNPHQLQFLANSYSQWNQEISPQYIDSFFNSIFSLANALDQGGLDRAASELRSFSWNLYLKTKVVAPDIEGTYKLTDRAGKKWIFTIARVRENQYFAALADADGFVHKSFTNLIPDADGRSFRASERDADTDWAPNWSLTFELDSRHSMILRDPRGDFSLQPLRGERSQTYPDYFSQKTEKEIDPQGHYHGVINLSSEAPTRVDLSVTAFPNYTLGRLTNPDSFSLNLNVGSRGTHGALYLTTGRLWRRTWTQLRGIIDGPHFRGVLIVGGVGLTQNFTFEKTKE